MICGKNYDNLLRHLEDEVAKQPIEYVGGFHDPRGENKQ
jgi:hypothetical protein